MSRKDLENKAAKLATKIAKIEPINPEIMDYVAIKDELLMRLHDAALVYGANLIFNCAMAFENAQRAVTEGDFHEGFKSAEQYIKELPNFENAERTKALWLELIRRKDSSGSLATVEQFELIDAVVVNEDGLSQEEIERLTQLEFAVQTGLDGFAKLGEALVEIRDAGLYKAYGTFEEYCDKRWKFSRSRAYQLIDSSKVVHNLLTSGVEPAALPSNESQARALSAVPEDQQADVWKEASKDGKASAAKIRAVAKDAITTSPSPKGGELDKNRPDEIEWNPNLWETPRNIAKAMATLLAKDEINILEPCAGTGQIARAIADIRDAVGWDSGIIALEILKHRADKLEDNRYFSGDYDFLDFDFGSGDPFDAVVTNPPFDLGMEFLERSLDLIKPNGRCLFLLPIAYFQTQERAKAFAKLNAHIHKVYPIVGRVAYLKNGVPESGRQCEDGIFDIRLGADCSGGVEFVWQ